MTVLLMIVAAVLAAAVPLGLMIAHNVRNARTLRHGWQATSYAATPADPDTTPSGFWMTAA